MNDFSKVVRSHAPHYKTYNQPLHLTHCNYQIKKQKNEIINKIKH